MGKCLITKLNGVVSNSDLLKIDEVKIQFGSNLGKPFKAKFSGDITLRAENGAITDEQGTTSLSETKGSDSFIYIKENSTIRISSKYNITTFNIYNNRSDNKENDVTFDFDLLKYVNIKNTEVSGGSNIIGDVSFLSDKNCGYIVLSNMKNIYGTIDFKGKAINITTLRMTNVPNVVVNVNGLSASKMQNITLDNATGTINKLPDSIDSIYITRTNNVTGDLSLMKNKLIYVSGGTFTWKNERDNSYPIISLVNVNIGEDCDRMLINQAKCPASSSTSKLINVIGTRTSASDTAVQTLQSKGYTVSITPA